MNGVIINDELHELVLLKDNHPCGTCSLKEKCEMIDEIFLCTIVADKYSSKERFVNRGSAKEFIEKLNSKQ